MVDLKHVWSEIKKKKKKKGCLRVGKKHLCGGVVTNLGEVSMRYHCAISDHKGVISRSASLCTDLQEGSHLPGSD